MGGAGYPWWGSAAAFGTAVQAAAVPFPMSPTAPPISGCMHAGGGSPQPVPASAIRQIEPRLSCAPTAHSRPRQPASRHFPGGPNHPADCDIHRHVSSADIRAVCSLVRVWELKFVPGETTDLRGRATRKPQHSQQESAVSIFRSMNVHSYSYLLLK